MITVKDKSKPLQKRMITMTINELLKQLIN